VDVLTRLFDTSGFPARWNCGSGWKEAPWLGWLHIVSDLGVWSAYLAIPFVLGYFLLRRQDLPFRALFLLFGAFILACGTTHLMEVIIFWWPAYRLAGVIKLFTAVVSWATVFALVPLVPRVLAMRSPADLEREIAARTKAEQALHRANADLERRVDERTAELAQANAAFLELTTHLHQVLWIMDVKESKILYVSPGYEKMWGRSCQGLLDNPHTFDEGIHPLDRDMMARESATMFNTGSIDVECRITRPDQTMRWVWIRGYPVTEQGRIVRLVGVIEDVTEKRLIAAE
jgi:PAS domain S-box-containing protein